MVAKAQVDYRIYKSLRKKLKETAKGAKRDAWEYFGRKLKEGREGNGKKLFGMLINLREGKNAEVHWIKNRHGKNQKGN